MEGEQPQQGQWHGQVEATLPATPAGDAWPHLSSFCALHLYMPGIDVCERVAGADGQPGCVRYVASRSPDTGEIAHWAREELLAVEEAGKSISYAVVASNMGFSRYVATIRVSPEEGEKGCKIVWVFECDPVQGWSKESFLSYLDVSVKGIAKKVEEAVQGSLLVSDP